MKMVKLFIITSMLMFSALAFAGKVNINSADAKTLAQELVGIGEKKAQLIVEYRKKHGAFKNADELVNVKGISSKTIDKNRDNINL